MIVNTSGTAPATLAQRMGTIVCLAITGAAAVGAFWMIWAAWRAQQKPITMAVIAMFVPYAFAWYYSKHAGEFERRQLKRVLTIALTGVVIAGGFGILGSWLNAR